ncbi:unnamed protein product [Periconia digitata]|uniref:Piwi domain-containing protein n=1 Tax=Periconia digitata TaxID=1303443 RepID=A0A9W4XSC9_9PLEO|nr:unnamed protein product [Periconia digitata]
MPSPQLSSSSASDSEISTWSGSSIGDSSTTWSSSGSSPTKSSNDSELIAENASKTALGNIRYEVEKSPDLLIVEVQVVSTGSTANVDEEAGAVRSSRLRRLALREFSNSGIAQYTKTAIHRFAKQANLKKSQQVALHLHSLKDEVSNLDGTKMFSTPDTVVEGNIFNALVMSVKNGREAQDIVKNLFNETKRTLSVKKTFNKKENKPDESLTCLMTHAKLITRIRSPEAYSKYIRMLSFHMLHASENAYVAGDSIITLPNISDERRKGRFEVGVRAKIDFSGQFVLTLYFDLIYVFAEERNARTLIDSQFLTNPSSVKEFLRGLYVRYDSKQGSAQSTDEKNYTYIRDVKSSTEIGSLPIGEEEKLVTIRQYYRNNDIKIIDDGGPILFADVGRNKPFWVALDLIWIQPNQAVPRSGHLTPALQRFRESFDAKPIISQHGDVLLNDLKPLDFTMKRPPTAQGDERIVLYTPISSVQEVPAQSKVVPKKEYNAQTSSKKSTIGVIYVGQDCETPGTHESMKRIQSALKNQNIVPSTDVKIVPAASVQEIMRQQKHDNSILMEPLETCDVLIGIISQEDVHDNKYKKIAAEIHRLGERKIGAITVCTKRDTVWDFFWPSTRDVFPTSILRKIKFMRGENILSNFPVQNINKDAFSQGLIVIGAYITHSASPATENSPSVSALVVSRYNECPTHFTGSSRVELPKYMVEETRGWSVEDSEGPDSAKSPEITELRSRLKGHFAAWKAQNCTEQRALLPRVVFYRSVNPHEDSTETSSRSNREVHDIISAYQDAFVTNENIQLTYVTASKNMHLEDASIFTLGHADNDTEFQTVDPRAKFQYRVHEVNRSSESSIKDIRELTIKLNNSAQLDGLPSLALPLHYASQLSRHVVNYYDFISRRDSNNVPSIARETASGQPYAPKEKSEPVGDTMRNFVESTLQKDHEGNKIRADGKEATHPWKSKLDDTMFYI